MAEGLKKASPLEHLAESAPESGSVWLSEAASRGRINLRGDAADPAFLAAVAGAVGIEPPTEPNTSLTASDGAILWLGPDEWLIETAAASETGTAAALETAFGSTHAAATLIGDAATTLSLAGPRAPDVLAKGMTLDLDPSRFLPGHCARSLLAKVTVTLRRPTEEIAYEITVGRSFADYAWRWLADAALEYGADNGS